MSNTFLKKNFSGNGANRYTLMHSIWQGKSPTAACRVLTQRRICHMPGFVPSVIRILCCDCIAAETFDQVRKMV
ncbi:hypothetical protein [Parageobacillus thermantarcticus]|uniref:hypothetical protein n=1 Tax=Parageobacillus thermantarcticus TaxID=186116 RepID=UPI000B833D3B|nr:hypothetical protein [Parageobacillus thermantarcticus]